MPQPNSTNPTADAHASTASAKTSTAGTNPSAAETNASVARAGAPGGYTAISYSVADGVATIALDRPDKLNAMNDPMKADVTAALKEAERDPAVRCVVLTGSGRAFCSGQDLDLGSTDELRVGQMLREKYHPMILKLRSIPKPVIAALNGLAVGMGASLALACDYRIMVDTAYMCQAFSKIGLIPDCGSTFFLPRMVGLGRAFELAALAEKIPAAKCLEWGLVNEVASPEQFDQAVRAVAGRLAQGPTQAYALLKRALNHSLGMDVETQLDYESYMQQAAARTADFKEGVAAFAQKRSPSYTGR